MFFWLKSNLERRKSGRKNLFFHAFNFIIYKKIESVCHEFVCCLWKKIRFVEPNHQQRWWWWWWWQHLFWIFLNSSKIVFGWNKCFGICEFIFRWKETGKHISLSPSSSSSFIQDDEHVELFVGRYYFFGAIRLSIYLDFEKRKKTINTTFETLFSSFFFQTHRT